jgi:hypothetical protein
MIERRPVPPRKIDRARPAPLTLSLAPPAAASPDPEG